MPQLRTAMYWGVAQKYLILYYSISCPGNVAHAKTYTETQRPTFALELCERDFLVSTFYSQWKLVYPKQKDTVCRHGILSVAHVLWSFIELQNFRFELTSNTRILNFLKLKFVFGDEFTEFWLKRLKYFEYLYKVFWTLILPKIQIFKLKFDPAWNLSNKTARLFEFHDTFLCCCRHCAKWRGVVSASLHRGSCVVDYYWSNTESPATLWWMQFFAAANFSKMSGRRTKVFSKRLKKVKRW